MRNNTSLNKIPISLALCSPLILGFPAEAVERISALSEDIEYSGRWNTVSGNSKGTSWGNTARLKFSNSSQISVDLQSSGSIEYKYSLYPVGFTGKIEKTDLPSGTGVIALQSSVTQDTLLDPSTTYMLKLHRTSEASFGQTTLKGFIGDDGIEIKPINDGERIKIEVIGDSITAAWKVDNPDGQSSGAVQYENTLHSYGALLAKMFQTDQWSIIAKSGIGVTPNAGDSITMDQQFTYNNFQWSQPTGTAVNWNFSSWQPDIVVLFLGTNDVALTSFNSTNFKSGYRRMLNTIRSNYPNAYIVSLTTLVETITWADPNYTQVKQDIKQVASEFTNIMVVDPGTKEDPWLIPLNAPEGDYAGDLTHPALSGQQKLATKLCEQMKRNNSVQGILAEHGAGNVNCSLDPIQELSWSSEPSVTDVTVNSASASWLASVDTGPVITYSYRLQQSPDMELVAQGVGSSAVFSALAEDTQYRLTVTASANDYPDLVGTETFRTASTQSASLNWEQRPVISNISENGALASWQAEVVHGEGIISYHYQLLDSSGQMVDEGSGNSKLFTGLGASTQYQLQVTASVEGLSSLTDTEIFTTKATPTEDQWDPTKIYHQGDQASYQGVVYTARWWTQNNQPDISYVWEGPAPEPGSAWDPTRVYLQSEIVSYQGNRYEAKWWTRGTSQLHPQARDHGNY
ncbi:GDSL-type esterase/lipase family protein [Dongshaea marina]|uniref:GDSL-type esterase/lipase family protein n=1 Tax=Dongshaea marina TaxID=2047966 RepID=UPI00131F467D|nr:GDSL-type esterase/lipase family protein [Dongshaea marina]